MKKILNKRDLLISDVDTMPLVSKRQLMFNTVNLWIISFSRDTMPLVSKRQLMFNTVNLWIISFSRFFFQGSK